MLVAVDCWMKSRRSELGRGRGIADIRQIWGLYCTCMGVIGWPSGIVLVLFPMVAIQKDSMSLFSICTAKLESLNEYGNLNCRTHRPFDADEVAGG